MLKILNIYKVLVIALFLMSVASCRMPDGFGFYQPITIRLEVPDGPPEFKAGWYSGCRTGLGNKNFANAFVYNTDEGPDYGSGIYQHDPLFQSGWGAGWWACILHAEQFIRENYRSFKHSPLD